MGCFQSVPSSTVRDHGLPLHQPFSPPAPIKKSGIDVRPSLQSTSVAPVVPPPTSHIPAQVELPALHDDDEPSTDQLDVAEQAGVPNDSRVVASIVDQHVIGESPLYYEIDEVITVHSVTAAEPQQPTRELREIVPEAIIASHSDSKDLATEFEATENDSEFDEVMSVHSAAEPVQPIPIESRETTVPEVASVAVHYLSEEVETEHAQDSEIDEAALQAIQIELREVVPEVVTGSIFSVEATEATQLDAVESVVLLPGNDTTDALVSEETRCKEGPAGVDVTNDTDIRSAVLNQAPSPEVESDVKQTPGISAAFQTPQSMHLAQERVGGSSHRGRSLNCIHWGSISLIPSPSPLPSAAVARFTPDRPAGVTRIPRSAAAVALLQEWEGGPDISSEASRGWLRSAMEAALHAETEAAIEDAAVNAPGGLDLSRNLNLSEPSPNRGRTGSGNESAVDSFSACESAPSIE